VVVPSPEPAAAPRPFSLAGVARSPGVRLAERERTAASSEMISASSGELARS